MKILTLLIIALLSSVAAAEPMVMPGFQNQNLDIRLSNNNALFNYDFRIPNQRVFSFNSLSYNEDETKTVELTTGVILREPSQFGSHLSVGATISALNIKEDNFFAGYISVFAGISDSNRTPNSLYYSLEGSVSPNIISFGDVDNVYKGKGEIGIRMTAGSNLFIGYNYLRVKSSKTIKESLIRNPFIGMSIKF